MAGISTLLDIGRSALSSYQQALAVTGQNIANVNNPDYSRQTAVLTTNPPVDDGNVQIGGGVQVAQIQRSVDDFVDKQLTTSDAQLGRFQAYQQAVQQTQSFFQDSTDQGLGAAMTNFFNAFADVSNAPGDATARSVLIQQGQTLAAQFNATATNLQNQRRSLDGQIGEKVNEINQLTGQIASLNGQIATAEAGGAAANDLRDQRTQLINNLAQDVDVTSVEDASGQVSLFIARGQALVSGSVANKLQTVANPGNSGFMDVQFVGTGGAPVTITSAINSGALKGLIDARDTVIPDVLTKLDTLASSIVSQVNQVHQGGYGLDGSTGLNFFDPAGTTAGTMAVSITDWRQIAASSTAGGVPGNNVNALALAAVGTQNLAALGNTTVSDYYAQVTAGLGSTVQNANNDVQAEQTINTQIQSHRAQISGVSLDEELVNLMQYQRAFEAASRVITTSDQLLQTIIGLKT